MTYDNINRGALFRDEKKADEKDRDYSGSINIDGKEFWISGWVKESKAGKKFLRCARSSLDTVSTAFGRPVRIGYLLQSGYPKPMQ
jgi:hypothetical protein